LILFKAPDVAQIQVTQANAPVAVVVGQTQQPVGHFDVLCVEFALLTKARFADGTHLAGHPYARTALAHCSFGHLPSVRWPHHFFFERLRHDLFLELLLKVYLLQAPVRVFELFHARHHRHVHAAVLGAPLVKRLCADAQIPTNVGHRKARSNPFDRIHYLAIGELSLLM